MTKHFYYIALGNGIAKILNLVTLLFLTKWLNEGNNLDLYFLLLNYTIVISSFINSIDNNYIIPEYKKFKNTCDEVSAQLYISCCAALYFLIIIIGFLLFIVSREYFIFKILTTQNLIIYLFGANLLSNIFLNYVINFCQIEKKFIVITFCLFISSILKFIILYLGRLSLSIEYIFLTQILINSLILIFLTYYIKEIRKFWTIPSIEEFKQFLKNSSKKIFVLQAGNFSSLLFGIINISILSSIGNGILTAYNLAYQIISFPQNIIIDQVGNIAAAEFNSINFTKDKVLKVFLFGISLILPISILIFFATQFIVSIIFYFFNSSNIFVPEVIVFLKYLSMSLPLLMINTVATKFLFSRGVIKSSTSVQILFNLILILAIFTFSKWLGTMGYLISYNSVYLIYIIFFLPIYLNRCSSEIDFRILFKILFSIILIPVLILFFLNYFWVDSSDFILFAVNFISSVFIYVVISWLIKNINYLVK